MKVFILDVDYEKLSDREVIRIWGKNEKGKTVVLFDENYYPYFFVLPVDGKLNECIEVVINYGKHMIKNIEIEKRIVDIEPVDLLKIYSFRPQDLHKIRDLIKHMEIKRGGELIVNEYEYEVNFYKKYLIDKGLSGFKVIDVEVDEIKTDYNVDGSYLIKKIKNIEESANFDKLKIIAIDIEVVEEKNENKIIMISTFGKDLKKVFSLRESHKDFVEVFKSEKDMLKSFISFLKKYNPDIIFTYNGDLYDWHIIRDRCEKLGIDLNIGRDGNKLKYEKRGRTSSVRIPGIVHIDLYIFVNNILSSQLQTEVLTLDAVASEILGDKKIELEYEDIINSWKTGENFEKLIEYNLKDSELTFRLGMFLLEHIRELSKITSQIPWDVSRYTYSQLVEWFLSRKTREKNRIIPNQPKWEEIQKRRLRNPYTGGFVKEPKPGIHENIAVLDFRSLYPSIMATFNVSPETIDREICKEESLRIEGIPHWFCKNIDGFVSSVVKELILKRQEIKSKMKKLTKDNREYSILEHEQKAIKTVTNAIYGSFAFSGARWYCLECAEFLAAAGRKFINFVIEEAKSKGFEIIYGDTDSVFLKYKEKNEVMNFLEYINKKLPGMVELDFQGFYKRGLFIPKGSAPGTAKKRYALLDENEEITVRGLETVRRDWCRLAKNVQRKVLEIVLKEMDVEKAVSYVKSVIDNLKKGNVEIKDLIIYEQLTKPIETYKQISPHVVAAKKLKRNGFNVSPGSIILYVITKGSGSISERAEPVELLDEKQIDVAYYINNQIIPAALRVLKVLGVNEEKLKGKSGLERFL